MARHIRRGGQGAAGGGDGARDGCGFCSCRPYLQNARFAGALRALCRALCPASRARRGARPGPGAVWARGWLHVGSSAARNSGPTCSSTLDTSASCKSWPHPFHSFGHATAHGGMNGGSTVHSRHGDDPGRTRTCQMAENAGSSSAHVVSPQACQSAHGIIRLASPCAVGLLIAHFKPFANSARRGGGAVP